MNYIGDINHDGYSDIIIGAPTQPWHRYEGYFGIFLGDPRIPTRVNARDTSLPPAGFLLRSVYPNPFNFETIFEFSVSRQAVIEIKVFDILGKEVKILPNTEYAPGQHKVHWNGKNEIGEAVPNGIYFVRMRAITSTGAQVLFEQTQKFTVVR